jgi:hypothetical protein
MEFLVKVSTQRLKDEGIEPIDLAQQLLDLLNDSIGGPLSVRVCQPKRKTKPKKGTRK